MLLLAQPWAERRPVRSLSAMEMMLRSALADYELGEEVAPGSYRARPPQRLGFGPEAVVRVWELSVDAAAWPAVSADLELFSSVDSPHLVRLIEAGPDLDPTGSGGYLVTEDPPGGGLASPAVGLDLRQRVDAVAGAARGAHALHESGLAHGSINADSILLADRGGVLAAPRPTGRPGTVVRVQRWQDLDVLDPDLARGCPPSRASDIWALAAVLHQVCSGASLYPGLEQEQNVPALQKVMFAAPTVDPSVYDQHEELASLLQSCFVRDPAARPATALELAERLDRIGRGD